MTLAAVYVLRSDVVDCFGGNLFQLSRFRYCCSSEFRCEGPSTAQHLLCFEWRLAGRRCCGKRFFIHNENSCVWQIRFEERYCKILECRRGTHQNAGRSVSSEGEFSHEEII